RGVGAGGTCHFLAHAMLAVLGLHMLLIPIIDEGVEVLDRFRPHIAAAAAIAPIRAAELDELLAAKRDAAVPARAACDIDLCFVEKLHACKFLTRTRFRSCRMMGRSGLRRATSWNFAFANAERIPV